MEIKESCELLEGKKVLKVKLEDDCLTVTFTGNTILTSEARSGPGADGGWHTWTEVTINGQVIIDK